MLETIKYFLTDFKFYITDAAALIGIVALICLLYVIRKRRAADENADVVAPGPTYPPPPRAEYAGETARVTAYEAGEAVRTQFIEHSAVFSGLYEAVYRLSCGKGRFRQGVVGDFMVRLNGISGVAELKERLKFLSGYAEWDNDTGINKTKELMEFFVSNGAIRDNVSEITVNSETYANYSTADGEMLYAGTVAKVVTPCWHIGGSLLEKGVIQKKEAY